MMCKECKFLDVISEPFGIGLYHNVFLCRRFRMYLKNLKGCEEWKMK